MTSRKPGDPLTLSYIPSATVKPVIKVKESDSLSRARTLMMLNNFSQLPVVRGKGDRAVGAITWEQIGRKLSANPNATLQNCIDRTPPKFDLTADLLGAIDTINEFGYTLVTKGDEELSGIVTSADLGATLALIARPILLLERLEDRLHYILGRLHDRGIVNASHFTKPASEAAGTIEVRIEDLPLGEKIRLTTDPNRWHYVTNSFDRQAIVNSLNGASSLRNRLMHFRELDTPQKDALSSLSYLVEAMALIADTMPTQDVIN